MQTETDTPGAQRHASEEEWNALRRGLYGYSEYLLQREGLLPKNPERRAWAVNDTMRWLITKLQSDGVIPPGADPYEWSKDIQRIDADLISMSAGLWHKE